MMTTQDHPARKGQRYNRIIMAVLAVAVLALFAGTAIGRTFAGLVVYAVACFGGVAALVYLQFGTSVQLGDERDRRLHDRASGALVMLVAYLGLPVIVGLYLLDATGYYTIPPVVWGAIYALSGLYLAWGAVYAVVRYRT
ncbi:MAG: hypothetical protein ABEJ30_00885 [Halorientalis sp.]